MSDQSIQCADCGTQFAFSASEQAFYAEKGFSPPRRCKSCRDAAKQNRTGGGGASRPSGGGYGGGPSSSRPRELHDATCASCGARTQVPFKPTGERPVYCRDCFRR